MKKWVILTIYVLLFLLQLSLSGCSTTNSKIVCYQNQDYLAFSEIIIDNKVPVIGNNNKLIKLINDAKSNLGKGCAM